MSLLIPALLHWLALLETKLNTTDDIDHSHFFLIFVGIHLEHDVGFHLRVFNQERVERTLFNVYRQEWQVRWAI